MINNSHCCCWVGVIVWSVCLHYLSRVVILVGVVVDQLVLLLTILLLHISLWNKTRLTMGLNLVRFIDQCGGVLSDLLFVLLFVCCLFAVLLPCHCCCCCQPNNYSCFSQWYSIYFLSKELLWQWEYLVSFINCCYCGCLLFSVMCIVIVIDRFLFVIVVVVVARCLLCASHNVFFLFHLFFTAKIGK